MLFGAKSLPNHAFPGSFETFLRLLDGQFLITLRFRKKHHLRLFFLDCFPPASHAVAMTRGVCGMKSWSYSINFICVMAIGDKPRGHPCPCPSASKRVVFSGLLPARFACGRNDAG
jgi:hypothetical protein